MNQEEADRYKQKTAYLKAVKCYVKICNHHGDETFCLYPGPIEVSYGGCVHFRQPKSRSRMLVKGGRFLP